MTCEVIDAMQPGRNHGHQQPAWSRPQTFLIQQEFSMSIFASSRFLPRVMWVDSASCAATGAVQLAATQPLAALTGLPAPLLAGTGIFLLVYALAAAWIARRQPVPRTLIGMVALGNLGWALGCMALIFGSGLALSVWGMAWLAAQALVVLALADLQWMGLRRLQGTSSGAGPVAIG